MCGSSFAGLATAYWMRRLGYDVTVVEVANGLKMGGTPVNLDKRSLGIVERMGLLQQVLCHRIHMTSTEFKNSDGETALSQQRDPEADDEVEIERDALLQVLFDAVKPDVEFMFGDSVESLADRGECVDVHFKRGGMRSFDLVLGCDGSHSVVRRLIFGDEAAFSHFLHAYFSITIVKDTLVPPFTTQMYNEPGKMVMLNAYHGKTDVVLCFASETEIPYDYRDEEQQRSLIHQHFTGVGWRTPELLERVRESKTFYFDKLCQMKMPHWSKGRVVLVGDAAYCPSPAAGKGGSLAIDGAAALADAFEACDGEYSKAFEEYDRSFRPYIEEVQEGAVNFGLEMFLPRTEEGIRRRNSALSQAPES